MANHILPMPITEDQVRDLRGGDRGRREETTYGHRDARQSKML